MGIRLVNQRIQEPSNIGTRNGFIKAALWDVIRRFGKRI